MSNKEIRGTGKDKTAATRPTQRLISTNLLDINLVTQEAVLTNPVQEEALWDSLAEFEADLLFEISTAPISPEVDTQPQAESVWDVLELLENEDFLDSQQTLQMIPFLEDEDSQTAVIAALEAQVLQEVDPTASLANYLEQEIALADQELEAKAEVAEAPAVQPEWVEAQPKTLEAEAFDHQDEENTRKALEQTLPIEPEPALDGLLDIEASLLQLEDSSETAVIAALEAQVSQEVDPTASLANYLEQEIALADQELEAKAEVTEAPAVQAEWVEAQPEALEAEAFDHQDEENTLNELEQTLSIEPESALDGLLDIEASLLQLEDSSETAVAISSETNSEEFADAALVQEIVAQAQIVDAPLQLEEEEVPSNPLTDLEADFLQESSLPIVAENPQPEDDGSVFALPTAEIAPSDPSPIAFIDLEAEESHLLDDLIANIDAQLGPIDTAKPIIDLAHSQGSSTQTTQQHVIFSLGNRKYAVPAANVREVGELGHVTPVPNVSDWLLGVTNLRGDILSLVCLHTFLGLENGAAPKPTAGEVMVVHSQQDAASITTGLVVDEITDIRDLPLDNLLTPSFLNETTANSYIRGLYEEDNQLFILLNLEHLLLSPNMWQFNAT